MNDDIKLTENEFLVLKVCNEEPGNLENIQRELKNRFSKKKTKEILDRLLKLDWVYVDEEFWAITLKGSKKLGSV